MSQLHGIFATLQLPPARAVTWLNGLGCRLILIPTREALDCSCCISWVIHWVPEAYGIVNSNCCPDLTPLPHRLGFVQVLTPFGVIFQPWLDSRLFALAGLYGHGLPAFSCGDRNLVTGLDPTGPRVSVPYPRSGPLRTAAWFIR